MNCQEFTQLLHAHLDQELDPVRSLEAEQHLKECLACAARYAQQQALRKVVTAGSLYFPAPPDLRERVRTALRSAGDIAPRTASAATTTRVQASTRFSGGEGRGEEAPASARRAPAESPQARRPWDLSWLRFWWLAPAALAALLLLLVWPLFLRPSADTRLAREIVSAHARSLMAEHLTDVASTDQHTVKPWFNGKVTFSPPVVDLAAQGFPLVGGRLDVIEAQPVAALVYQRRKHFINLFIWPASRTGSRAEKTLAQRGYHLIYWTAAGMDCWAVSDVNQEELLQFAQLVRERMLQPEGKTP